MKNRLMKYLAGLGFGFAAATASAAPLTVGCLTWNPDDPADFAAFSLAIRQLITLPSGEVNGWGSSQQVNGVPIAAGCEVSFTFSGYTPTGTTVLPVTGTTIDYTGGVFNIYIDNTPDMGNSAFGPTFTNPNAQDGILFLSLVGNTANGFSLRGTNNAGILTGTGYLDVVGGAAASYFDFNTQAGGSDVTFSASFTSFQPAGDLTNAFGTGNLFSDSRGPVPLPGVAILFGAGLLAAGLVSRRK
jgi:hypothetical protein